MSIAGHVPKPGAIRSGCQFAPRCPYQMTQCLEKDPSLQSISHNHRVACFLMEGGEDTESPTVASESTDEAL